MSEWQLVNYVLTSLLDFASVPFTNTFVDQDFMFDAKDLAFNSGDRLQAVVESLLVGTDVVGEAYSVFIPHEDSIVISAILQRPLSINEEANGLIFDCSF